MAGDARAVVVSLPLPCGGIFGGGGRVGLTEAESHQQHQSAPGLGGYRALEPQREVRCPGLRWQKSSREKPGSFLPAAHRIHRALPQRLKCRALPVAAELPGSREQRASGRGASRVPAPAPLGATGLAQPRQPTSAPPELRRRNEAGRGWCWGAPRAPQPPLGDEGQAPRGTQSRGVQPGGPVGFGSLTGLPGWQCRAELGELTIRRDLPVRCRQGRAGSRQSLHRVAAGPQRFLALRYLLRLHLLQGIAVHVPLGVTGHLAALKHLSGRSQPTSWKGSTRLSRGQRRRGREAFRPCPEGSRSSVQPQGNRSASRQEGSVSVHEARQEEKETEAQRGKEAALLLLPGSWP